MAGIDANSVLVCRMDGTTTSFVDSSPSHKAVTANGNATQITRKFNGTGAWFDGSVDTNYVQVPDSADFNFGTGEFTIESFVMFTASSGSDVICEQYTDGSNYSRLEYSWFGGVWQFSVASGGGLLFTSVTYSHTPTLNTWYHIAIRRSGTDVRMYLDGSSVASQTATFTYPNYSNGWAIGGTTINSGYGLTGWLKEIRISNVARTVSVPTSAYTSDANTVLLLHFDNALATGPLAPAIKLASSDYLTVADSADWDFGTGDFTLEGWYRFSDVSGNNILYTRNGTNDFRFVYIGSLSQLEWSIEGTSVPVGSITLVNNRWYHLAMVRSSGNVSMYIDGVSIGTTANSGNIQGTDIVYMGYSTSDGFKGWAREMRISNSARYTAAFTPSQTGFTVDSNTKLYIKGNESNGVTAFVDSESSPKTVTTVGDTKINYIEDYRATIFKDDGNTGHKPYAPVASLAKVDFLAPFGSGVCALDGTGDYLSVGDSADWDFGTGAFTLEAYVRWSTVGLSCIVEFGSAGVVGGKIIYDAGVLTAVINNTSVIGPSFTPVANIWYHIAMVRSGSNVPVFANGVLLNTGTNSSDVSGSSAGVRVGSDQLNQHLTGYIDNARISNVARYTATFNPPGQFNTGGLNQAVIL